MSVRLVAATTMSEKNFWCATYLGRSLSLIPQQIRPEVALTTDNGPPAARGLPAVYNAALEAAADTDVLVFVHDDVYVHDWFISTRVQEAMQRFDVAGVAGSAHPDLAIPAWGLELDVEFKPSGWQEDIGRSGAINRFDYVNHTPEVFGLTPQACALLDGMFLAVNAGRVRRAGVRFDERLTFHLYDLDFCRSATAAGLQLGTWPIALTHDSVGAYGSAAFTQAAAIYLAKWADAAAGERRRMPWSLHRR